jgi:hypothetical protein
MLSHDATDAHVYLAEQLMETFPVGSWWVTGDIEWYYESWYDDVGQPEISCWFLMIAWELDTEWRFDSVFVEQETWLRIIYTLGSQQHTTSNEAPIRL